MCVCVCVGGGGGGEGLLVLKYINKEIITVYIIFNR